MKLAYLVLVSLFALSVYSVAEEKISEEEFLNIFASKEKKYLSDEELKEANSAYERLSREQKKIEELSSKAAEAEKIWRSLSPEKQAELLNLAQERAQKKKEEFRRELELLEKLKIQNEKEELERNLAKELEEVAKKREEERRKIEEEELQKEWKEFKKLQTEHQKRQAERRTTRKALFFWFIWLFTSFTLSALFFRNFKRKVD